MGARITKLISPSLFWIQMLHLDRYFKEMLEDLNIYMERKKDRLFMLPHNLTTDTLVAIYTKKGWQRGYIARINEDETVQVMLRDWGILKRHSNLQLYRLEKQFCEQNWFAISCGLAHAGPITQGAHWSHRTRELARILAEEQEGWFRIIKPVGKEAALVKLTIAPRQGLGCRDLLDDLVRVGHAEKREEAATAAHPSVEDQYLE